MTVTDNKITALCSFTQSIFRRLQQNFRITAILCFGKLNSVLKSLHHCIIQPGFCLIRWIHDNAYFRNRQTIILLINTQRIRQICNTMRNQAKFVLGKLSAQLLITGGNPFIFFLQHAFNSILATKHFANLPV